jgi:STE24 endopeptidase
MNGMNPSRWCRNLTMVILMTITVVVGIKCVFAQEKSAAAAPSISAGVSAVGIPIPSPAARQFYITGNLTWAIQTIWEIAIPIILLRRGWPDRIRRITSRFSPRPMAAVTLNWVAFALIFSLASLPINFARSYLRLHYFGLSEQSFISWLADLAKMRAIEATLGLVGTLFIFAMIQRFPRKWWIITAGVSLPVSLALVTLQPILLEPIFNQFAPLHDKALESKIVALAATSGLARVEVVQCNKSKQTKALNAYVSGLFGTARIVLWDTLFPKMSEPEILSIVAHELGHRVLHHILKGTIFSCLLVAIALLSIHKSAPFVLSTLSPAAALRSLGDPADVPAFVLLLLLASLILTPVGYAFSRHIESDADTFAVELTRDGHASALVQQKLSLLNLANPDPNFLFTLFRGTHPSDADRIRFFNTYKPWETGAPLKFSGIIQYYPTNSPPSAR